MTAIRVATYNIYLGAELSPLVLLEPGKLDEHAQTLRATLRRTHFPSRARAIAKLLVRERIDLVGLQEVTTWTEAGEVFSDALAELTDALEELGAPYDVHAFNRSFGGSAKSGTLDMSLTGGCAILRRRDSAATVVGESVAVFDATMTLPPSPEVEIAVTRGWSRVDLDVDGRPLTLVNTHTEAYDDDIRDAQREQMVAGLGDGPTVVVGDFNALPDDVGMPKEYADAWLAAGNDPAGGLTWGQAPDLSNPENTASLRIDFVFVRDAEVTGCSVVGFDPADRTADGVWPSDHAGVVAEILV
ncbi:endonuclease/exonuclease/phosphatase family protein [Nocardioides speluncae]|uniref:endonuclease/exonuclease/phosphatase family protein n=1 Tax=Nocardioides speluncae TaxID=2670337 RepID=UPI000D68649C|nr:endonuclease/exonuclease/phosphatase family protein [Nocardioides speluncae]